MADQRPPAAGVDPRSGPSTAVAPPRSFRRNSLLTTAAAYAFSLLFAPCSSTRHQHCSLLRSYPSFISTVRSLAGGLWSAIALRPSDVALVVSPSRLDVPLLNCALLSIGAVVSSVNPASIAEEYAHMAALSRSVVAFAVPEVAAKLPRRCMVIGSDEYNKLSSTGGAVSAPLVVVKQSNTALCCTPSAHRLDRTL